VIPDASRAAVGAALFHHRYPVAARVLEELADDPSVSPEVYVRVCDAIFDVADRHVAHVPGPPRSEWKDEA
jgi:hypothetical protein